MRTSILALIGKQVLPATRTLNLEPPYPGLMDTEHIAEIRQGIQSVENAMTVLLALERGAGPMILTQIAESCGMRLEEFKVVAPATVGTDRREQCSAR